MTRSFRLVGQTPDIVFRAFKAIEPLVKGLSCDAEMFGSKSGILLCYGIVEHHPFYTQSLLGCETLKVCHFLPQFILITTYQDNGFSLKEIKTVWLSHPGNSSW
jgi:hypothetical protein